MGGGAAKTEDRMVSRAERRHETCSSSLGMLQASSRWFLSACALLVLASGCIIGPSPEPPIKPDDNAEYDDAGSRGNSDGGTSHHGNGDASEGRSDGSFTDCPNVPSGSSGQPVESDQPGTSNSVRDKSQLDVNAVERKTSRASVYVFE